MDSARSNAVSDALVCRRATPDDYEAVKAIRDNVYNGYDYLPNMYHQYLEDPTRHCYLVTVNGTVVSGLPP